MTESWLCLDTRPDGQRLQFGNVPDFVPETDVQTRKLVAPWPFLYSVVPGIGMVKNVEAASHRTVESTAVTAGLSLRQELAARGIRPAGSVPERLKRIGGA